MALIASVLSCVADFFLIQKGKKTSKIILCMTANVLCCNFITIFVTDATLRYSGQGKLFSADGKNDFLPFIYFGLMLLISAVWIIVTAIADGKYSYKTDAALNKKQKILRIVSIILFMIGSAAFTGIIWGIGTFGDLEPDQMLINTFSPRDGTSSDIMITLWTGPVIQTVAFTLFFALFAMSTRVLEKKQDGNDVTVFSNKARSVVCFILSISLLTGSLINGIVKFNLIKLLNMYTTKSELIEENFANPYTVKMQFPEKKRNLIHIYLESMENTYASKALGGYMDENLITPLTDLAKEGYSFSNNPSGLGGPVATTGCVWSVAGMVNMNTGLPMKVPMSENSYSEPGKFMEGAVSLGDILHSQGYEQTLMFGATAKFGGLNFFYEGHGNVKVMDYDYAKENGMIAPDYKVWWGFEDDKLFEFAKEELTRLHNTGKPFNFTMETADTHFPDGYVGKNTPRKSDSQYADVIAYSASEVADFVEWIKQQPFYENTTIVLIGDHLSMDAKFFKDFDDSKYLRTTFNLILNPAPNVRNIPAERMQNRWYFNGDMYPTILASLGVKIEGEKLALGTNLFSGVPTLFESNGGKKGWEKISNEFTYNSSFYYDYIVKDDDEKDFDAKNITVYKC